MKKILFAIIGLAALIACDKDDPESEVKANRTVVVYMAAENNLGFEKEITFINRYAYDDIQEMKQGIKAVSGGNHLVIYVDKCKDEKPEFNDPKPYLLHFWNGELRDSIPMEESLTSDPAVFEKVLRHAFTNYPADSYGLVLWGHSNGWDIKNDSVKYTAMSRKKAYGGDTGNNTYFSPGNYWLNLPTMAKVLSTMPHLTYIFADCCNFMCLESIYELRNVADYIIGSPAEIPAYGAPYHTVTPALFEPTTLVNGVPQFAQSIVDRYYDQCFNYLPLSVVKTSEMANLASATGTALNEYGGMIGGIDTYPNVNGVIYYYYNLSEKKEFFDANDFMLNCAQESDKYEAYEAWKKVLDQTVIYKKMANRWMTDKEWNHYYGGFEVTEEKFSGVSMFVPQYAQIFTNNKFIRQMGWYYAAGYADVGW